MGQSCGRSVSKDVEECERLIEVKSTDENHKEQIECLDEKGKKKKLLKLITKENEDENDFQEIKNILEENKTFLTDQYWMDQKIKSILRIAKYGFNKGDDIKQKIVLIIIDVGYRLFEFSENLSIYDMSHSLFFVAAKGDLRQLTEIVTHFEKSDNVTKIHDTREGDTILSFMAKYGDYIQENFLNCFRFMLAQGVDIERTDYYKNNLKQIIVKQIKIFQEGEIGEILNTMYNIVDTSAKPIAYNAESTLSHKYQLFLAIIHGSKNLIDVSKKYKHLVNSDDGENTLLQLAIIKNNVVIAKELLNMGANPNQIVKGRNEEVPLVLAGKLGRHNIFTEILKNKDIEISESTFVELVKKSKWKFTNPLLESKKLNVDFEHNGKIPLQYAIKAKNRKAVKSLLERGSCVNDTCLRSINPKDLEYYLNSCIHSDYQKDLEENSYKSFLVFDFFLNSSRKFHKKKNPHDNSNESGQLYNGSSGKFESEVAIIRNIGNIKRLKHLLEHPLVYIYIMLKWHCVWKYYYFFVILKSIFYLIINILLFTGSFNFYIANRVLLIQIAVVFYNYYSEFRLEFKRYTLHFILEICILVLLIALICLKLTNDVGVVNQISAFVIIFTSVSLLQTIGYHLKLSKWMSMAKRVFKSFSILLIFFMIPIIAFAMSFTLLLSVNEETSKANEVDFSSFPRALSRTLIMIGGDIGDKKFTGLGSYLLFLFFTVGIAIILLNFWTGVAVSDIKEIEEQSTIVAFKNVIVFIESTEKIYHFIVYRIIKKCLPMILKYIQVPFLDSKIYLNGNKFCFGIDFYINSETHFQKCIYFENCKIPSNIISKLKTLSEQEKDETKLLETIMTKLSKLEQLLQLKNVENK